MTEGPNTAELGDRRGRRPTDDRADSSALFSPSFENQRTMKWRCLEPESLTTLDCATDSSASAFSSNSFDTFVTQEQSVSISGRSSPLIRPATTLGISSINCDHLTIQSAQDSLIVDNWFRELANFESIQQQIAISGEDPDFCHELKTIMNWFESSALTEAQRMTVIYSLLAKLDRAQARFFRQILTDKLADGNQDEIEPASTTSSLCSSMSGLTASNQFLKKGNSWHDDSKLALLSSWMDDLCLPQRPSSVVPMLSVPPSPSGSYLSRTPISRPSFPSGVPVQSRASAVSLNAAATPEIEGPPGLSRSHCSPASAPESNRQNSISPQDFHRAFSSASSSSESSNLCVSLLYRDIPAWLRALRLHKYTHCFDSLYWKDLVDLDDQSLLERGVKAEGARRKFLKLFAQIKTVIEADSSQAL